MNIPGFTAETSLYKTSGHYVPRGHSPVLTGQVYPALTRRKGFTGVSGKPNPQTGFGWDWSCNTIDGCVIVANACATLGGTFWCYPNPSVGPPICYCDLGFSATMGLTSGK